MPVLQGYMSGKAINWTDLDTSLDIVIYNHLIPGFEIMGRSGPGSEGCCLPALAPALPVCHTRQPGWDVVQQLQER